MSKMFGNLSTEGAEKAGDVLGGGRVVFETDAYEAKIKMAYVGKSQSSDAQGINLILDIGGQEFSPRAIYITNRNGENFYKDKNDGSKKLLPGFEQIDELCLVTTGQELSEQDVQEKTIEIYNFDEKKMVPTNMPVLVDLIGKDVIVCIEKQNIDKTKKEGDAYVPTGETVDVNEIAKFVHLESRMTVTEAREELDEPVFLDKWVEKNKGNTRQRAKGAQGKSGAPGRSGGSNGAPAPGAGKPKTSLFGK